MAKLITGVFLASPAPLSQETKKRQLEERERQILERDKLRARKEELESRKEFLEKEAEEKVRGGEGSERRDGEERKTPGTKRIQMQHTAYSHSCPLLVASLIAEA